MNCMLPVSISQLVKYKPNSTDDFLVGRGFLSRGGSLLICGEPGCGKSKFTQHEIFAFALGLPFLGLIPTRKLKVLYVQNEDTLDDMHESLVGFKQQYSLTPDQLRDLDEQCVIISAVGLSGEAFVDALDECIREHKPDIVVTDPLLAFIGCDLTSQANVTVFLRERMAPLMKANRCGWICVHHTSKGAAGGGSGSKVNRALGSVEIAAFFRGVIDLERKRSDANGCKMEITKRHKQAGLKSPEGKLTNQHNLRCGEEHIGWEIDGTVPPPAVVKSVGRPVKATTVDVESFIAERRKEGDSSPVIVKAVATRFGYSVKQARRYVLPKE